MTTMQEIMSDFVDVLALCDDEAADEVSIAMYLSKIKSDFSEIVSNEIVILTAFQATVDAMEPNDVRSIKRAMRAATIYQKIITRTPDGELVIITD